jgi:hypothetical protein
MTSPSFPRGAGPSRALRLGALPAAIAVTLATPALALAVDLTSGGGFLFDIEDEFGGYLNNGSIDAYDACYYLDVGGTRYSGAAPGVLSPDGRTVEMAVETIGGLSVHRVAYVPASGGDWIRYLEVLENTGATDVTTTVRISGNLGSDGGTSLIATSSGDGTIDPTERWFATDDTDGSLDPSLVHLFQAGPDSGAPASVRTVGLATDNIDWTFDVTVPARGRAVVMTFAIQTMTQALAQAEAARLLELPDDAFAGMEEYETDIVNFPPRTILTDCTGARVGARCDDNLFCTRRDRCTAAGTCVGTGDPCDDANACTVDACLEASDSCTNTMTPDRCVIGGECVANGVVHPAYPCLYCDPARNARDWTSLEAGTVCGAASCEAGRLVPEATCSMTGVCLRAAPEPCAVGYCADASSCASMCEEGSCPGDSYCGPSGECELPRADGSSCTGDPQCQSGHCVDRICCSEGCTETCRSCIVPGMVGTCVDVPAMTDPDRECPGGFCDGEGACAVSDGGVLLDAAVLPDAGPRPDAGAPDAALSIDANLTIDAAITPPPPSGGCSASTRRASPLAALTALLALALTTRRRRR